MSEIPNDIMETAREAYAASPVKVQGHREANVLIGVIARAVLAERERATAAERERCVKIVRCNCDNSFCELDEAADRIERGDQPSPSAGERGSVSETGGIEP